MQTCIGLDVGRSTTKVVVSWDTKQKELLFPSAVVKAFSITDELEAGRAQKETVLVNNVPYFFGHTAALQSGDDLTGGMSEDWVFSDQHSALFLGALQKLTQAGVPDVDSAIIVVGLPAMLYASQKTKLINLLTQLMPRAEIRVSPQSLGPFHQMMFTPEGRENGDINPDEASWAVIEVGQFTTDYAMLLQGRPVENAYGSCEGMRVAAEALQRDLRKRTIHIDMNDATEALRTKTIKDFGKTLDVEADVLESVKPLAAAIINKSNQLIGQRARNLNGILVAGGGAPLIYPVLKEHWPHVHLTPNSRYSVADGFCRFAKALALYRASREKPAKGSKSQTEEV